MPDDRSELQTVIDFFGVPLVVDVLLAVRDGRRPRDCPELCAYVMRYDTAITALAATGAVRGSTDPDSSGSPLLTLTNKGREVCSLVERVIDLDGVKQKTGHPVERAPVG
ncbi:hypothetical protein [Salinispora arenicola]|uniref:hypothetical protein n=1 Tax=Salinispora arenicola TaxID=168697 RepID=UPI0016BAA080|nr:hypothetical protein [Salinispora arenicola]NIL64828.1 hypothetical protein [Salinispora arenicola]